MIEVENLTKSFSDTKAVDDVTFSVARGEVLGFLGPNGAGKSTVMKMISGFLKPDRGRVRIAGINVETDPIRAKERIGYLPEGMPLYDEMPVHSFLAFNAKVRGINAREIPSRIASVVTSVRLQSVLTKPIHALSKGYRRRVGLAQALLHDPQVLVLDEPTDGLDPLQKEQVRNLIRSIAEEKAIILSTHILEEVDSVCTRVIIIDQGRIVANQVPEELIRTSRLNNAVQLKIPGVERDQAMSALTGIEQVGDVEYIEQDESYLLFPKDGGPIVDSVWKVIDSNGWTVRTLSEKKGNLDDVFRTLTQN